MLKINLLSTTGKETVLLPEEYTLRQALEQVETYMPGFIVAVNGARVEADDLDRHLRELSDGPEMCIKAFPDREAKETAPVPDAAPIPANGGLGTIKAALLKAKEALEEAIKAVEEEELPF